jgi:hypothetical protein
MSRGQWKKCSNTGIPLHVMVRAAEEFLTFEGEFDPGQLGRCDLFDVRSISAAAGFKDHRYFSKTVLRHPESPFHTQQVELSDERGNDLATVIATHTNSAEFGGKMWRELQRKHAVERAKYSQISSATECNSRQVVEFPSLSGS